MGVVVIAKELVRAELAEYIHAPTERLIKARRTKLPAMSLTGLLEKITWGEPSL